MIKGRLGSSRCKSNPWPILKGSTGASFTAAFVGASSTNVLAEQAKDLSDFFDRNRGKLHFPLLNYTQLLAWLSTAEEDLLTVVQKLRSTDLKVASKIITALSSFPIFWNVN